jgi:hypothetical protein
LLGGWTITWVALIVVLLTTPKTSTRRPVVTALADAAVLPCRYDVAEFSFTVTFSPVDVLSVKLDPETLVILPDDPPSAGPERAFDPPPDPKWPTEAPCVAVAAVAVPDPPPEVASTIPNAPPATSAAAAADAIHFLSLSVTNISMSFALTTFGCTHRCVLV